jgi:hypothetical protein
MSVVSNSNECWLDFGVSISKPNHSIKTRATFRPITNLIGFQFFIKYELICPSPTKCKTLFIIFIEHQFKRVLK